MFRLILWRELLDHLQSLRFAVGFVLIVGCFVASAVSWNVRQPRDAATQQEVVRHGETGVGLTTRRDGGTTLVSPELRRPLSPLGFIAGGHDRGMPNHAMVHDAGISLEQKGDRNPLLLRRDIDWAFIIGFLGTLLALLLTHDSIAGEKEGGTLRQTLANPVPRHLLLLGKVRRRPAHRVDAGDGGRRPGPCCSWGWQTPSSCRRGFGAPLWPVSQPASCACPRPSGSACSSPPEQATPPWP